MALQAEAFSPGQFESEGMVTIGGKNIPFRTVCQDHVMHDEEGKQLGSVFSYSYFRSDVNDSRRPVLFLFNGGPGSGSIWLHVGLFGPLRVMYDDPNAVNPPSVTPFRVENNQLCLLDICDLVFFDPVGTGFGRLLDKDAAKRFYGMDEDAECLAAVIHSWLGLHDRWQSPKYLLGESYGTVRAALVAEALSGSTAADFSCIGIDGLVLLGNAIGMDNSILKFNAEDALLALPSMAAANWYHNSPGGSLEEFVARCYDFCEAEYVTALYKGASISDGERDSIAQRLAFFTGLPREEILRQDLRPDMWDYLKTLLKDRDLEIGIYDGRFTLPLNKKPSPQNRVRDDAAIAQYTPSFMAAMNGPVKKSLNITFDRKYYAISSEVSKEWKREAARRPAECLMASMRRNPDQRVLFATGCYDMICQMGQARYLANHIGLPPSRVRLAEYASGHMAYLGEGPAAAFAADVRAMVEGRGRE